MISKPRFFRTASFDDFASQSYDRLAQASYKHVAFPLGCSSSEFQISLDESEICLFQKKSLPVAFVRIKSIERTHIYFDLFCTENENIGIEPLQELMQYLEIKFQVNKFFVQLLAHESIEIKLLQACGFKEEARLSEHLWLQGKYHDMFIMGSPLNV